MKNRPNTIKSPEPEVALHPEVTTAPLNLDKSAEEKLIRTIVRTHKLTQPQELLFRQKRKEYLAKRAYPNMARIAPSLLHHMQTVEKTFEFPQAPKSIVTDTESEQPLEPEENDVDKIEKTEEEISIPQDRDWWSDDGPDPQDDIWKADVQFQEDEGEDSIDTKYLKLNPTLGRRMFNPNVRETRYAPPRCLFCRPYGEGRIVLDPTNVEVLGTFLNYVGEIYPRQRTGTCRKHQRKLSKTIKRARHLGMFSYKRRGFMMINPFNPSDDIDETRRGQEFLSDIFSELGEALYENDTDKLTESQEREIIAPITRAILDLRAERGQIDPSEIEDDDVIPLDESMFNNDSDSDDESDSEDDEEAHGPILHKTDKP